MRVRRTGVFHRAVVVLEIRAEPQLSVTLHPHVVPPATSHTPAEWIMILRWRVNLLPGIKEIRRMSKGLGRNDRERASFDWSALEQIYISFTFVCLSISRDIGGCP